VTPDGQLFATDLGGVGGRAKIRKATLDARCAKTAELAAAEPGEPWVIWCGLNAEADTVARLIPGAVNVHGAMSPEEKAEALLGFADGAIRVIVTKPSIASFRMNAAFHARMAFCGLGDSYEQYYRQSAAATGTARPPGAPISYCPSWRRIAERGPQGEQAAETTEDWSARCARRGLGLTRDGIWAAILAGAPGRLRSGAASDWGIGDSRATS
jgi:hypothetical protein